MGDRMNPTARLGLHVATSLTRVRASSDLKARAREKLLAGRAAKEKTSRSNRTRRSLVAFAMASAAALFLGAWFAWPRATLSFAIEGEKAPGVVGAFLSANGEAELPLAFSDGTRVVLGKGARARVAHVDARGARVLLESGELHANVVHRDDTRWLVEAGPYQVRVTGTRFDVRWDADAQSVVVRLIEGSVIVSGCTLGEGRRVSAGEELVASCKESPSSPPSTNDASTAVATVVPDEVAASPAVTAHAAASHVNLAAASSSEAVAATTSRATPLHKAVDASAVVPSGAASTATETVKAPDASELLLRADDDRFARRYDDAENALLEVRKRFGGTDAAAKAAFELGRIKFDARGDFGQAASWFDTYLHERPTGTLAREALGRGLEARLRAEDTETAANLARRYLAAYPDGPHAKLARKALEGR
ncbi:hypothetical protein AKJ09_03401 [Labilithrix luteola]|uniref:FecR protein domain-containing protein n=1 Tax=Labilithrix luteola TaxID=1391654 RepID=A0A0K1PTA6_9BACT|nr:FecR domain-containing protein [Labilithrix luteola]AKU96737.1 hypothetical protein AKJ09_03401 [Labilithrix luteola]